MRGHNLRRPAAAAVFLPPYLWSIWRAGAEDLDAEAPKDDASLPRALHHGMQRGMDNGAADVEADPHVLWYCHRVRHRFKQVGSAAALERLLS